MMISRVLLAFVVLGSWQRIMAQSENHTASFYEGKYECHLYDKGGKNNWHYVTISAGSSGSLTWSNRAGVSWTLTPTSDPSVFEVGTECPYYSNGYQTAKFVITDGVITEVMGPWGEPYKFEQHPSSFYEGKYENHLYDKGGKNNWHYVTISAGSSGSLTWSNRAGVSWTLTPTSDPSVFNVGAECPYYNNGYKTAKFVIKDGLITEIMGPFGEPYKFESRPSSFYEGKYECHLYDKGGKNNWHYVTISAGSSGNLTWSNRAGVSWTLTPTSDPSVFNVGAECPYYNSYKTAKFVIEVGVITEVMGPWREAYLKEEKWSSSLSLTAQKWSSSLSLTAPTNSGFASMFLLGMLSGCAAAASIFLAWGRSAHRSVDIPSDVMA